MNKLSSKDYNWYKEHKICIQCRQNDAFAGHVVCSDCLYKMNEYWHKQSDEYKQASIKKAIEWQKKNHEKGLCKCCNKPVSERNKWYCEEHRLKVNRRKRENSLKRKIHKSVEEIEAMKAEKLKKLQAGYREYQKSAKAKINNANYKKIGKKSLELAFLKRQVQ